MAGPLSQAHEPGCISSSSGGPLDSSNDGGTAVTVQSLSLLERIAVELDKPPTDPFLRSVVEWLTIDAAKHDSVVAEDAHEFWTRRSKNRVNRTVTTTSSTEPTEGQSATSSGDDCASSSCGRCSASTPRQALLDGRVIAALLMVMVSNRR